MPLHFRGVNANGFGDFDGGFAPGQMTGSAGPVITGCEVGDDFNNALGDPNEAQLASALNFAETGACTPAVAASSKTDLSLSKITGLGESDNLLQHPRFKASNLSLIHI